MNQQIITSFYPFLGMLIGVSIGFVFGTLQNHISERNQKLQISGKLQSGWNLVPGSMTRVALLMVILVVIQAGFPVIFSGQLKWLVSAGVITGYGWTLYQRSRKRKI